MVRNGIVILLRCLVIMAVTAFSQETMVLNLEQSVELALQNNPEIKIAEKEVAKARAAVGEAYATLLPTLDANSRFSHAWELQRNVIPNFLKPMLAPLAPMIPELALMPDFVEFVFGLENTITYSLTVTQPLFMGGGGIAGVKMARAGHRASEHQLESKKQNLIYQTSDAFYACLLTRELIGVQEEALGQAQANMDIVLTKYEVGTASGLDKMRAEVEVANLKPVLIAAKNNHQSTLTRLRMVLGLSEDVSIQVQGALDFTVDGLGDQPLEDLLTQAYLNRPELSALESQKKLASSGIAMVRSGFLPKIFFQTDYSLLAMRNDLKFTKDDFNKGFTSAVSLQIPLFHGLRSHRQYQKAKLDFKIVQDSEKSIRDGIAAEVEIVYNTFREAREKHQAATESVSLAEEALRLANLMYEEGASTQLDVLSSQLALTRARLNRISALYEYQKARYALRRVTGTLTGVL
jgi:outer membrane protein